MKKGNTEITDLKNVLSSLLQIITQIALKKPPSDCHRRVRKFPSCGIERMAALQPVSGPALEA